MSLPVYVLRNGALIAPAQASVSIFNPAIYGAFGAYESMQVSRSVIFALKEHLRRLEHSAALLDLPLPADLLTFEAWCREVVAANEATDATLRLFVVGGDDGATATAYLWPEPARVYPAAYYASGAPAITFAGQRYMPQAKSLNALASYLARRAAQARDAHEGLLHHDGLLTEGSNSNLFAVMDGRVVTPPPEQVLSGVTRDIVLDLATRSGIHAVEAPLLLESIPRWEECFITSTNRHVMPVTAVDGRPVGDGRVGPVTRRVMGLFEECFSRSVGCP